MENSKLFVLGKPQSRCSFVYYGEPLTEEDKWYPTFKQFQEYEIESVTSNKDGSFDIKLKDIDFTYKNVLPYKAKQG